MLCTLAAYISTYCIIGKTEIVCAHNKKKLRSAFHNSVLYFMAYRYSS